MQIGIGLPNTLDIDGSQVTGWARRAEERSFFELATIDRIVYPTYDSLISLAVAAGATTRIGLLSNILLAPTYPAVWLAKATASLHAMSGGRLRLGLAVGGREDDYAAVDRPFDQRGRTMDETLTVLRRAWAGEPVGGGDHPVGPAPPGGRVPILIGGTSDAAVRRTVQYGDAGREGEPRMAALVYFGLGDPEASRASLRRYYGFLGDWTEGIVESAIRSPDAAKDTVRAFGEIGMTELLFMPTVPSVDEVDRLADAVL